LAKHQHICCYSYIINLAVQAFLFIDSKEAVEAACQKIEELDKAVYNTDIIEGWRKKKALGWQEIGPFSKVYNICIYIRANDYQYNLFQKHAGRVLGLDNNTCWNL
jgi:hypothetical protein